MAKFSRAASWDRWVSVSSPIQRAALEGVAAWEWRVGEGVSVGGEKKERSVDGRAWSARVEKSAPSRPRIDRPNDQ